MVTGSGAMRRVPGAPGAARQRLMGARRPATGAGAAGTAQPGTAQPSRAQPSPGCAAAPGLQQPRGTTVRVPRALRGSASGGQAAAPLQAHLGPDLVSALSRLDVHDLPHGCAPLSRRPARLCAAPSHRAVLYGLRSPPPLAQRPPPPGTALGTGARHRPLRDTSPGIVPDGSGGPLEGPPASAAPPVRGLLLTPNPVQQTWLRHLHPRVAAGHRRLLRLLFRVPLPRRAHTSQPLLQNSS